MTFEPLDKYEVDALFELSKAQGGGYIDRRVIKKRAAELRNTMPPIPRPAMPPIPMPPIPRPL